MPFKLRHASCKFIMLSFIGTGLIKNDSIIKQNENHTHSTKHKHLNRLGYLSIARKIKHVRITKVIEKEAVSSIVIGEYLDIMLPLARIRASPFITAMLPKKITDTKIAVKKAIDF